MLETSYKYSITLLRRASTALVIEYWKRRDAWKRECRKRYVRYSLGEVGHAPRRSTLDGTRDGNGRDG